MASMINISNWSTFRENKGVTSYKASFKRRTKPEHKEWMRMLQIIMIGAWIHARRHRKIDSLRPANDHPKRVTPHKFVWRVWIWAYRQDCKTIDVKTGVNVTWVANIQVPLPLSQCQSKWSDCETLRTEPQGLNSCEEIQVLQSLLLFRVTTLSRPASKTFFPFKQTNQMSVPLFWPTASNQGSVRKKQNIIFPAVSQSCLSCFKSLFLLPLTSSRSCSRRIM